MWPSRQAVLDQRKTYKRTRGCNLFRNLTSKQRLYCKIVIALLVIAAAVGLGVGISRAVGGGVWAGDGKSKEIPLLTTGTTISSKVINVDLDITDQTADVDETGTPRPIKVRVLASAIVSVGDTDALIKTAANRFFSKAEGDQVSTLTDLLSSSGRRAINLLTHDQLFSAKTAPVRALPSAAAGHLLTPGAGGALVPAGGIEVVPSAAGAVAAVESGLSARGHYSLLGALLIFTAVLAPMATGAALRIATE